MLLKERDIRIIADRKVSFVCMIYGDNEPLVRRALDGMEYREVLAQDGAPKEIADVTLLTGLDHWMWSISEYPPGHRAWMVERLFWPLIQSGKTVFVPRARHPHRLSQVLNNRMMHLAVEGMFARYERGVLNKSEA